MLAYKRVFHSIFVPLLQSFPILLLPRPSCPHLPAYSPRPYTLAHTVPSSRLHNWRRHDRSRRVPLHDRVSSISASTTAAPRPGPWSSGDRRASHRAAGSPEGSPRDWRAESALIAAATAAPCCVRAGLSVASPDRSPFVSGEVSIIHVSGNLGRMWLVVRAARKMIAWTYYV